LDRLNFYRLADTAGGFGFIDISTQQELQSYTAMKGFIGDVAAIGVAPVSYTTADLPSVIAPYSGYFPLTTVPVVGRVSAADPQNSFLFVSFQRSYGAVWTSVSSPPAVPITVNLPAGTAAVAATDLVTRQAVSFTTTESTATYSVADNPVALKIVPLSETGPVSNWRQTWFGSPVNSGNAADAADPYHTGVSNLEAFAFLGPNRNPTLAAPSLLPQSQLSSGNLFFSFTQPVGTSGVTYHAEWSATLQNDWQPISDTGAGTQHLFSVPVGSNQKFFIRLRVTDP
jgi:hypothetical protein